MNSFAAVDPRLIDSPSPEIANSPDGHGGYTPALQAADTKDALKQACGSASKEFPKALWIEPRLWAEKCKENDANNTWPYNYVDRYTHQGNSHECTSHSLRTVAEACRNRQRGIIYPDGPKVEARYQESSKGSVWLSPLSVYCEANPGQWGGAGCRQVLEIACRRGFLPDKIQPHEYGLKHTLQGTAGGHGTLNQSDGNWVRVRDFPDGWEETAKWFKPLEVIFTDDWEQCVCLVLHGYALGVGRNGHAIPWSFWNEKERAMGYIDSYNRTLFDSLGTVKRASDGAFAIASMTVPNDWMTPTA